MPSSALKKKFIFFFLMIRRPPRSTLDRSSAASDVYKRQDGSDGGHQVDRVLSIERSERHLSLIHISEPTRLLSISYAVFCFKKKIYFFFFNDTATTEIYTRSLVGSVRCV